MVKSMFAAVAGLRAHQQKMDVIGNNIANVNTYGFKKARMTFTDQFYTTLNGASDPDTENGGGNPSQVGYGSTVGSIDINFSTGGSAPTDNTTDCMIGGNGFFMLGPKHETGYSPTSNRTGGVQRDNPEGLYFSRVGNFKFGADGYLTDSNKNIVYGYINYNYANPGEDPVYGVPTTGTRPPGLPADRQTEGEKILDGIKMPLVLMGADGEPVKDATTGKFTITYNHSGKPDAAVGAPAAGQYYAPMSPEGIAIGEDGTITGKFEDQVVVIGQIAIANVPNANALMASGGSYYEARGNTGVITAQTPGNGGTGGLETSRVEMSNVDLSQEMTDMITTQRGFQANTRIITVTDEMLQEMINMKR